MRKFIIIIIAILGITACKEEKSITSDLTNSTDFNSQQSEIEIFNFPDTVTQNTMVQGNLKYNRNFGDVRDSEIKERYIFFHVGTDQNSDNITLEEFDKFPYRLAFEDTIGDGLIEFETVFTKSGINYLHGVVKDMYEIGDSNQKMESMKVSQKETTVTKRVFVKEE